MLQRGQNPSVKRHHHMKIPQYCFNKILENTKNTYLSEAMSEKSIND